MKKEYTMDQVAKTFILYATFNVLCFLTQEDKFRKKFLENIKTLKATGEEYNDNFTMDVNFLAAIAYNSYEENHTEESFEENVQNALKQIDAMLDVILKE